MRRLATFLGLAILVGAVVFGSVKHFEANEGDGRSPMEQLEAETAPEPTDLLSQFCPRLVYAEGNLPDDHDGIEDELVPGEPEELLLCRYWGMNHSKRSNTLGSKRVVADPAAIREIAAGLNDLPPFPEGEFACPNDEGSRTYAIFGYSDDPPVVVEISTEGCGGLSNGSLDSTKKGGPIVGRIQRLVPLPGSP